MPNQTIVNPYGAVNYDRYRYQGPNGPGAIMWSPELQAEIDAVENRRQTETSRRVANQRRMENIFKAASIAIPTVGMGLSAAGAGAAAAPSSFGIGAANTGTWTSTLPALGATAPKVGATSGVMGRLGKLFSSAGFETVANTGLSLLGMRQQNKASDQARQDTLAYQTKQIELEQQRLAQELQNATLDREDARALNAAIQELEKKKFALAQESAQFDRENALFNRGIIEREQGVKDRYRSTIQEPAAARLRSILGLG